MGARSLPHPRALSMLFNLEPVLRSQLRFSSQNQGSYGLSRISKDSVRQAALFQVHFRTPKGLRDSSGRVQVSQH